MKIGVVSRSDLSEAVKLTKKVLKQLAEEKVMLAPGIARKLGQKGIPIPKMRADVLVTIGGDGTVLHAQQKAPEVPILGIDMGGTGFLADVSPEDAQRALKALVAGKLRLEERMRLATEISGERLLDALNEAAVHAISLSRMLGFEVLVDGEVAERARGDGMIIATPTGSTAYAMAAGGSVVDPRLEAFVVVPLITYRPRGTPLVIPASSEVEVKLLEPRRKVRVTIDGRFTREVGPGDKLLFRRSERPAKFFKWGGKFYQKVREKL